MCHLKGLFNTFQWQSKLFVLMSTSLNFIRCKISKIHEKKQHLRGAFLFYLKFQKSLLDESETCMKPYERYYLEISIWKNWLVLFKSKNFNASCNWPQKMLKNKKKSKKIQKYLFFCYNFQLDSLNMFNLYGVKLNSGETGLIKMQNLA